MIEWNAKLNDPEDFGFVDEKSQRISMFAKRFLQIIGILMLVGGAILTFGTVGFAENNDMELWRLIFRSVFGIIQMIVGGVMFYIGDCIGTK